jgi:hypothetical protein
MQVVHIAKRHEQDAVFPEADNFGRGGFPGAFGLDHADFPEGRIRSLGFDDQAVHI